MIYICISWPRLKKNTDSTIVLLLHRTHLHRNSDPGESLNLALLPTHFPASLVPTLLLRVCSVANQPRLGLHALDHTSVPAGGCSMGPENHPRGPMSQHPNRLLPRRCIQHRRRSDHSSPANTSPLNPKSEQREENQLNCDVWDWSSVSGHFASPACLTRALLMVSARASPVWLE